MAIDWLTADTVLEGPDGLIVGLWDDGRRVHLPVETLPSEIELLEEK